MLIYTLVARVNGENFNYKLLGSTFESDVAIYLYYTNIEKFKDIYFVFTKTEFYDFNQFSDFTQEPLEFFVREKNNKISELLFEDQNNIFRLKSDYYTESLICSESEEKETNFSDIICCNEKEKKNLLPSSWILQDDDFFEHHYEAEVLYVSVLTYQKNNGDNITCLAGASYHEQTCALLLDEKIKEIEPDWCHFYFKPLFIFKNQISRYLNNKELKFCSYSDEPDKQLALIPIENNEKHIDAIPYTCKYKTLTSVDEDLFEDFIDNSWDKYQLHFEVFEEESFEKSFGENISKEDIITTYISELHKYYLYSQEDWNDVIRLLKELSLKDNLEISLNCNIIESSAFYNDNFESTFLFLKDCIQIAKDNDLYEDLAIGLLIRQRTGLKSNNVDIKRASSFILHKNGIYSLNKNEVVEFLKEEQDENFYIEEKTKYISSGKLLSILNMDFNLN